MRVHLLEANQLRFRADGRIPLLVRGISSSRKKLLGLKIRKFRGRLEIYVDGSEGVWRNIPGKNKLSIRSNDPRGIWLGKRRYRGELTVTTRPGGLQVVNNLELEKYLASVVGSEMPKSWPFAALQAQAIAARTYALKRLDNANFFYDIRSDEKSQVYLGIESETRSTRRAVKSTRSLVLLHKGNLINAVFHSSSGGRTEASGDVWKYQHPYLVSVPDFDHNNPSFLWIRSYEKKSLNAIFPETNGLNSIQVINKSDTGRVKAVRVFGPNGDIKLTGDQIRQRLGLKSTLVRFDLRPSDSSEMAKFDNSLLLDPFIASKFLGFNSVSLNREQNKKNIRNIFEMPLLSAPPPIPLQETFKDVLSSAPLPLPRIPNSFVLIANGLGAGHGVGMSQWGAHGMAKSGANYRQILRHYYKGVLIKPYY